MARYVTMSVLWLQSSLLRTRPVWRGVTSCGGVLQSCYRPAVTRSHYIVTHLTHYTSVYLPWDFINWGGGGFHVFFGPLSVSRWRWTMMVGQILDGKSMTLPDITPVWSDADVTSAHSRNIWHNLSINYPALSNDYHTEVYWTLYSHWLLTI